MADAKDSTTRRVKITPYQAFIASGSDISNPAADSGYDTGLVSELHRVGTYGGTVRLSRQGLLDLAEFAETLAIGESQSGNTSGARSLQGLADLCQRHARELDPA